jgi:UDP-GlcNAc:undecaprenyl-phosphate/decaprenyl-phosphate GlcNAc-1-phosphate transferase
MPPITLIYIFMTALFASLIMVPFLHRWGMERSVVDSPDERKLHQHAVPRLGGISICMAFLFSILVYVDLVRELRGIMAGALIVFVTGLVDDLYGISSRRKFFGEICAVLTTMMVGHLYIWTLGDLFGAGEIVLPIWIGLPFTLLAVIGVINAFNLIDGLDGLAGGVSVISLVAFSILAFQAGFNQVVLLSAALLGALLGFLKYNFYPARIFMGDAGSLVVGLVIGFLAIRLTQVSGSHIQPIVPLLIIGLPVADTVLVMFRRILSGQSPFIADRGHVHHKFLAIGFEHRYTVILIYGISLLCAACAVFFHNSPAVFLLGGYLAVCICFYGAIRILRINPGLTRIFGKDSAIGIRESAIYRKFADRVAVVIPLLLQMCIMAYLTLAATTCSVGRGPFLHLALIFLAACIALLFLTRDSGNPFLLAMYYGVAIVMAYAVNHLSHTQILLGIPVSLMGNILPVCMAVCALTRYLFRRDNEFFLTSLDYLLLGLSLFLVVVAPQMTTFMSLSEVVVHGIILFIAIKVVAEQRKFNARIMAGTIFVALLVIAMRGFLE